MKKYLKCKYHFLCGEKIFISNHNHLYRRYRNKGYICDCCKDKKDILNEKIKKGEDLCISDIPYLKKEILNKNNIMFLLNGKYKAFSLKVNVNNLKAGITHVFKNNNYIGVIDEELFKKTLNEELSNDIDLNKRINEINLYLNSEYNKKEEELLNKKNVLIKEMDLIKFEKTKNSILIESFYNDIIIEKNYFYNELSILLKLKNWFKYKNKIKNINKKIEIKNKKELTLNQSLEKLENDILLIDCQYRKLNKPFLLTCDLYLKYKSFDDFFIKTYQFDNEHFDYKEKSKSIINKISQISKKIFENLICSNPS